MRQYIYIINRGIAFLAVCLSLIGCGNADIDDVTSLAEVHPCVLHQTLPEEWWGTWYNVQDGDNNYRLNSKCNISSEGVIKESDSFHPYYWYFIDYTNKTVYPDWKSKQGLEILYFKDGLFVFGDENDHVIVLNRTPNATISSLTPLHELSGTWTNGSNYITIDKDGTVIRYDYIRTVTKSLSFNEHLFLIENYSTYNEKILHISYENTGEVLKIGEQTFTKLQDVPDNFCGTWYRMNDWYISSNIDLLNITHSGMCFKSDASVLGNVNYSANTLFLHKSSLLSIDYMSEDYLILSESQYGNTAIYNRDPQNTTISVEAADPALFGTWASEISPTRYITINDDGTIKNYDGQTGRYFNYKGTLYSTVNLIPYNSSKKHTYQITDNELLLGDIKFKKATVTE